ncbi:MAG: hypothetical protein ACE366_27715 [Bradymonadia bacterium]
MRTAPTFMICALLGVSLAHGQDLAVPDPMPHLALERVVFSGPPETVEERMPPVAGLMLAARRAVILAGVEGRRGAVKQAHAALQAQGVFVDWEMAELDPHVVGRGCADQDLAPPWKRGEMAHLRNISSAVVNGVVPAGELVRYAEGGVALRTRFEGEGGVQIGIGATRPYRIWVDGHLVASGEAGHRPGLDARRWPLRLRPGAHTLEVLLCRGRRPAEAIVRLSKGEGEGVPILPPSQATDAGKMEVGRADPTAWMDPQATAYAAWLARPDLERALQWAHWATVTGIDAETAWQAVLDADPTHVQGWTALAATASGTTRQRALARLLSLSQDRSGLQMTDWMAREQRWAGWGLGLSVGARSGMCGPGEIGCRRPDDPGFSMTRAITEAQTNASPAEALARLAALAPGRAEVWAALGDSHWAAGRLLEAREAWRRGLALGDFEGRDQVEHRTRLAAAAAGELDPSVTPCHLDAPTPPALLVMKAPSEAVSTPTTLSDRWWLRLDAGGRPQWCRELMILAPPDTGEGTRPLPLPETAPGGLVAGHRTTRWFNDAGEYLGDEVPPSGGRRLFVRDVWAPVDRRPRPGRAFSALIPESGHGGDFELHIEAPMDLPLWVSFIEEDGVQSVPAGRLEAPVRRWRLRRSGPRPQIALSTAADWSVVARLRADPRAVERLRLNDAYISAKRADAQGDPLSVWSAWTSSTGRCGGQRRSAHSLGMLSGVAEGLHGVDAWGCAFALQAMLASMGEDSLVVAAHRHWPSGRMLPDSPALFEELDQPALWLPTRQKYFYEGTLHPVPRDFRAPHLAIPLQGSPRPWVPPSPGVLTAEQPSTLSWQVTSDGAVLVQWAVQLPAALAPRWPARDAIMAHLEQAFPAAKWINGARDGRTGTVSLRIPEVEPVGVPLWPFPPLDVPTPWRVRVEGTFNVPERWDTQPPKGLQRWSRSDVDTWQVELDVTGEAQPAAVTVTPRAEEVSP